MQRDGVLRGVMPRQSLVADQTQEMLELGPVKIRRLHVEHGAARGMAVRWPKARQCPGESATTLAVTDPFVP